MRAAPCSLRRLADNAENTIVPPEMSADSGVVRQLFESGRLERAYCTETRPYNQGSRLTAFELLHDCIPGTLICDNMAAALMATGKVHAVVVGADRVTANGDTANKIGGAGHSSMVTERVFVRLTRNT
ncbi:hypothetical protein HPB51_022661 [Rhipicephalus microplus]|uniref:Uncharacterized protein n=1 Tax=Rhipicephalus microplus TaxID=6941 RepID=A0A9J6E4Z6_RHIMP|nr:hypothetical protein HPB51_022661 [Rhipicephalus microplus]